VLPPELVNSIEEGSCILPTSSIAWKSLLQSGADYRYASALNQAASPA
jgi:hypothetical protein